MKDLDLAKRTLAATEAAFVLVKDGTILHAGTGSGIGELIETVDALGDRARGGALADKIVGRAAAMVARVAGIRAVYAEVASEAGQQALAEQDIPLEYARLVPLIRNQHNDGPCPMERLTLPIYDPELAVAALRQFISARSATRTV